MIKPLAGFRRSKLYEFGEDIAKVWFGWSIIRALRRLPITFTEAWHDIRVIPRLLAASTENQGVDVIGPWFLAGALLTVAVLALFIRPSST